MLSNVRQDLVSNDLIFEYTGPESTFTETVWYQLQDKDNNPITEIYREDSISQGSYSINTGEITANKPWILVAGPHITVDVCDTVAVSGVLMPNSFNGSTYQGTTVESANLTLENASVKFKVPSQCKVDENKEAWIIVTDADKSYTLVGSDPSFGIGGVYGAVKLSNEILKGEVVNVDLKGIKAGAKYRVGLYLGGPYRLCAFNISKAIRA